MKRTHFGIMAAAAVVAACGTQGGAISEDAGFDAGSVDASTDPQAAYSYPGCEDAGTAYCPNDRVLQCALMAIAAKYDGCDTAADCAQAPLSNCVDIMNFCPPAAVSHGGRAAFIEEANAEGRRYCDGGTCRSSGLCGYSYAQGRVDCISGHCIALPDADAGI